MTHNQRLYWLLARIGRGDKVEHITGHLSSAEAMSVVRAAEDDRLLDPADIAEPPTTFKRLAKALDDGTVIMCEDEVVAHVDHTYPCFECGARFSSQDPLIDGEFCEDCHFEALQEAEHREREASILREKRI